MTRAHAPRQGGADGTWHPAPDDARPLITLPAGEWSHLVLSSSRELGTTTFYVDGIYIPTLSNDITNTV